MKIIVLQTSQHYKKIENGGNTSFLPNKEKNEEKGKNYTQVSGMVKMDTWEGNLKQCILELRDILWGY